MSQPVDFNWVLKVKNPSPYLAQGGGVEVKGGYRVFPMSWHINLVSWDYAVAAQVTVTQITVKRQADITDEDARVSGFSNLNSLQDYLVAEYPEEEHLATFVTFKIASNV